MKELREFLDEIKETGLTEIRTFFYIAIALFIAMIFSDFFWEKLISSAYIRFICYIGIEIIWFGYWVFLRLNLPRNEKGKVGIVIAIYAENEQERENFRSSFLSKLNTVYKEENMLSLASIITLKDHLSKKINEANNPIEQIRKINSKVNAHLYIYGDIKKRPDGEDGEKYFLNFEVYVAHNPISAKLSNELSKDFAQAFPRQVEFLENRSFRDLQNHALRVNFAIKYIIGVAAYISQNPILALKMHETLREKLNSSQFLHTQENHMKDRLSHWIASELVWIARWEFFKKNRDNIKIHKLMKQAIEENKNSYDAWLFQAIIDFVIDKDVSKSMISVNNAEKLANGALEWRYSKAFLYFWTEKYKDALKMCLEIRKYYHEREIITLTEVREFNLEILRNNKNKPQLYFWIGYLSYFKQDLKVNALEDFENFEKRCNRNMIFLKKKSSAYLKQIKKDMGNIK